MHTLVFLGLMMFGQAQPAAKLPEEIQNRVLVMDLLAEKCQYGDPGEKTWRACELHDAFYKTLKNDGWCYGHEGQKEAEREWEPCRANEGEKTGVKP